MALVSYREYARMQGVTLKAIQDRIRSGTISADAIIQGNSERNSGFHPKIDSDVADEDFRRNGDHGKKTIIESVMGKTEKEAPAPKPPAPEIPKIKENPKPVKAETVKETVNGQEVKVEKEPYRGDSEAQRYISAKSATEELRSRKIYLEVMELENRLVDKDEVREALTTVIQETRAAILNVADKVALQVLGKKDLLEVKTILKSATNEALSGLQKLNDDF